MKFYRTSARNFLVLRLKYTHKQAIECIASNRLRINGKQCGQQQEVEESDEVELDGKIIYSGKKYFYIAYYKPKGIECTLNKDISDNLIDATGITDTFFPVGRLDKASEGLLLLTNDGFLCDDIIGNEKSQEKEYEVTVDRVISNEALEQLAAGVIVMGKMTKPAIVERMSSDSFRIILTQGLNRQIRRMCHKVGYEVQILKRIRIANFSLGRLELGKWRYLSEDEINTLRQYVNTKP